jgi:hypothetical protein
MNEIKLRPGEEFVYNGIRFICLDIIGGNYLAITADCWCDTGNANDVRYVYPAGAISLSGANSSFGLAPVCLFNSDNLTLRRQAQLISAE